MFIVIEMQTTDGTTAVLTDAYADLNTAYQKYHLILSAAAVSSVPTHTAVILSENGNVVASECFAHAEPEEEEVAENE